MKKYYVSVPIVGYTYCEDENSYYNNTVRFAEKIEQIVKEE